MREIAQTIRLEADAPLFFVAAEGKQRGFYATRKSFLVSALADEALAGGLGLEGRWCSWCVLMPRWYADELFAHLALDNVHRRTSVRADDLLGNNSDCLIA